MRRTRESAASGAADEGRRLAPTWSGLTRAQRMCQPARSAMPADQQCRFAVCLRQRPDVAPERPSALQRRTLEDTQLAAPVNTTRQAASTALSSLCSCDLWNPGEIPAGEQQQRSRAEKQVQVRVIIVETSVPVFHVYGGVVPLGVPSDRKCPPSAEKSPLGLQAVTDGDVPVSLTCSARERPGTDREERVPSINRG